MYVIGKLIHSWLKLSLDLLKQTLCDSLPQSNFGCLLTSGLLGFHEACFDKKSLAAIIQHCKGDLKNWNLYVLP